MSATRLAQESQELTARCRPIWRNIFLFTKCAVTMGSGNMDEEHCSVDILNWLMYRFAFEVRNYFESLHMGHVHSTTRRFWFRCPQMKSIAIPCFGVHCDDFEANAEHHQRGEDTQRPCTMGVEVPRKCWRASVWNNEQTTCSALLE